VPKIWIKEFITNELEQIRDVLKRWKSQISHIGCYESRTKTMPSNMH